ncbi:hypothetical protein CO058_02770 [candidate division WWE3 bacterium CG_4_9_14_0_2_um_filter_35_11]|uniref:Uncharacterized protein n=1 Tax=candidate division WWE3 bacterium CG_4_9_14_0_2_um_filter_35_11 TaxID=1975077 RepID=A0A2M8ELH5_UNCKA|nr:MAG: hypothetical protein COV25_04055 [candidate division WWE3 bacterium CG10_big_fil_rev_8_21_14_0_10_35_32]PJC23565.1 MAG: hypothetical protein CO058_02770 [candidate division WWE3 bacterium CG_4_9_14_0_2_um_filter_35_11]
MEIKGLQKNILTEPPTSIFKLLGPSFILIGLGLGTGELILWPYLVANWGLGIIWGAALGITMQFFLNMEIERYALANGESVFVGFARLYKKIPIWFILSTAIAFSWPGFSAAAASVLKPFGLENTAWVAVSMLLLSGAILTLGPVLYKTVEGFQKILVSVGIPLILFIVLYVIDLESVGILIKGMVGVGDGYLFAPKTLPFMSFLAAFAYSGAGGNLNLAQSFYIKEKGYGMGKYAGRITSLITGKQENVKLEGTTFEPNPEQVKTFYRWWKMVNIEHFIVFWGLGLITILLLALLSYITVFGNPNNTEGINFIYNQAQVITTRIGPVFGALLLLVTSFMLFSTQLSVIDASGRILTENLVLLMPNIKNKGNIIPKIYYSAIWILISFGILVLLKGTSEPKFLIILGAVLNAFCMFVFSGILIKLNTKLLPKAIHPSLIRKIIVYTTFAFFGVFSFLVIYNQFFGA